ncbi:hypothetical protein TNIN_268821 [Trichonephila inaurata madagascariensis]|uniref:Uncharacterized protein n=1 Tax=Trichonephila inaurata madagascariensis TaxID=2747483 RepID=A0A8X7C3L1_9ARAC|nr:hypothetical protein TNIN_268821 [Trichonephila inaurata madagascariensis]
MIYEVFLHLLQCALTLVFRNDLPSFFDIFILDLMLELFKPYSTTQLFDGSLLETSPAALPMITVEERIPVVHSLAVWKMCEALDLKAKFVPLPGALPRTPHRGIDQTATFPIVGSFSVWKICQALDLPATYDPQIARIAVFRRPNKPVPVVHSTAIFELCKPLDLKAKLAPQ